MTGKVEKQVRAILAAEADNAFTVEDLCERVYGSAEKKHRVSMLRVVRRISDTEPEYALMTSQARGNTVIVYDCRNAHAYGMACGKGEPSLDYQGKHYIGISEHGIRQQLTEKYADLIAPGGTWWRHSRMGWLQRSGEDPEELAALEAEQKKAEAASMASFASIFRTEPSPQQKAIKAGQLLREYFEATGETSVTLTTGDGGVSLRVECFQAEPGGDMETKTPKER